MSIVIDLILVAVFAGILILFARYGFAETVHKIGKVWLSLFISIGLGPLISTPIHNWFLSSAFTGGVSNTLENIVNNNPNGYNLAELFQNLPTAMVRFLDSYNISSADLEAEFGSLAQVTPDMLQAISERIAEPCAAAVSGIAGNFLGWIIPLIFFNWLEYKIRKTEKMFYYYADKVVGYITGIALGYCAVLGISLVIHTIFQSIVAFDVNTGVVAIYENSYIFKFVSEFNLWGVLSGFFT